jgi:elongation factor Ts
MSFTAQDVKTLREKTGAGMMECKKALDAASGDMEKAVEHLRKQGLAAASKKAGRVAAEGAVRAFVSSDGKTAALVELNCETDFVAKTDDFLGLADQIAQLVVNQKLTTVESVLAHKLGDLTVEQAISEKIAKMGEKITLRRLEFFHGAGSYMTSYIHGAGSIGTVVEIGLGDGSKASSSQFIEFSKDLAMHTAAAAPRYLTKQEVPQDAILKELEIYKEVLRKEGKKEEMLDKIAEGKLGKFYEDVCLMHQPFVKDPKTKITQLLESHGKTVGTELAIRRFARFVLGEGIEKKQGDFAAEVMSQVKV